MTTSARPLTTTARLKRALVGDAGARFAYVGNFEVERRWAVGETGLPRPSFGTALVDRMDELVLPLAGPGDVVVLSAVPDPGFLQHLATLGFPTPTVVAAADAEAALTDLGRSGGYLLPHGVSTVEEGLAGRVGLRLAAAGAAVAKAVNSKVYSRRIAADLGLRQPAGWACATLAEFAAAVAEAAGLIAAGRTVVVKDAFGVSGKGLMVAATVNRLDQIRRLVETTAARAAPGAGVALVVEEWVATSADLSYQFTVGPGGAVGFDHVREAVIDAGVHQGNRAPARLPDGTGALLRDAAERLGARLSADGYHGVVGVDAMLDPDGGLYPVGEINARNTMSTYSAPVIERLAAPGAVAFARHYPVRPVSFDRLRSVLGGLLVSAPGDDGFAVTAFAPVAAGRLYGLLTAATQERLDALDTEVRARLEAL